MMLLTLAAASPVGKQVRSQDATCRQHTNSQLILPGAAVGQRPYVTLTTQFAATSNSQTAEQTTTESKS